ncbi:MAG: DNA polymerase I, partial [Deltaproteobacteria bacterium]|nr:DNA polymerase I [Deltaproteobacteria bacterium]
MAEKKEKRLFIIDGSSVLYRAFHAVPPSFSNSKGLPTNAIYGFTQTLRKILQDGAPDYAVVAFDVKGPTFRHAIFAEYKAGRPPMPDALSLQIPYIKRIAKAFGVTVLEHASFEADDIIAAIAKKASSGGFKTAIITGDKDMYQLVNGNTVIFDYLRGKEDGEKDVEEKFGVGPSLISDLIGLAGDASDGIPGVTGIGFKTAAKLLKEYGSIEGVYGNIDGIKGKMRENLIKDKDRAFLSKELATLHTEVPFEWSLDGFQYVGPDYKELIPLLRELEFEKILKEISSSVEGIGAAAASEAWRVRCMVIDGASGLNKLLSAVIASGRAAVTLVM